ncbi:hypothetical protein LTR04_005011, partial [Oleoguttula sp. CCFEE 6159]
RYQSPSLCALRSPQHTPQRKTWNSSGHTSHHADPLLRRRTPQRDFPHRAYPRADLNGGDCGHDRELRRRNRVDGHRTAQGDRWHAQHHIHSSSVHSPQHTLFLGARQHRPARHDRRRRTPPPCLRHRRRRRRQAPLIPELPGHRQPFRRRHRRRHRRLGLRVHAVGDAEPGQERRGVDAGELGGHHEGQLSRDEGDLGVWHRAL